MSRDKEISEQLNDYQDEYFKLLINVMTGNQDIIKPEQGYNDNWERLKELQRTISVFSQMKREITIGKAKEKLEEAFTPRIKSMLSKKVLKEMEDGKEE